MRLCCRSSARVRRLLPLLPRSCISCIVPHFSQVLYQRLLSRPKRGENFDTWKRRWQSQCKQERVIGEHEEILQQQELANLVSRDTGKCDPWFNNCDSESRAVSIEANPWLFATLLRVGGYSDESCADLLGPESQGVQTHLRATSVTETSYSWPSCAKTNMQ